MTNLADAAPHAPRLRDGRSRPPPDAVLAGYVVSALALTGGAVALSVVSTHAPDPLGHAAVTALVCLSFVAASLLELRNVLYVRFGCLLAAVALASLLGALHDANGTIPYTVGVLFANLVFAVLVHTLLAFPHGRLAQPSMRRLVVVAYLNVVVLQAVAILFDPLTRWHSDHPPNGVLVASHATLATALEELEGAVAVAIAVIVVVILSRRANAATPAGRRFLVPVFLGGEIALLFFSAGLVLAPISSTAAVVGIGLGLLASLAVPAGLFAIAVQGRLSRAAVGELLVELREPGRQLELRDSLRRALGDPQLELVRAGPDPDTFVDDAGVPVAPPQPGGPQVATIIRHRGKVVGALVHDRALRFRPELLDAVSAAAGFSLANERAFENMSRAEHRSRALLDAIPDAMIRVSRDGTYLDVRADENSGLVRPPDELIGRNIRDVLPPDLAHRVLSCVERTLRTGRTQAIEYELEIDGVPRWKESRMVPSGRTEVVTIVRDFTQQRRAEAAQRRLGAEQAALRRVATLVAGDAPPERVFQTVTEEVCKLLGLRTAVLIRYEDSSTSTVVGKYGDPMGTFEPGSVVPLEDGTAFLVRQTGAAARSDFATLTGRRASELRSLGFGSSIGVPISVGGVVWGALVAALREEETMPVETEHRLGAFAEIVALGVASAHARDELAESRRRIVEASDEERRRIERNLHDGAQQRLVALSVALRLARSRLRSAPDEVESLLDAATDELGQALTELRELAQGIHPAVLTERGLTAALEVLAARAPLRVALDVQRDEPWPDAIEAAAYYVVAEALANIVKHAHATLAEVRVLVVDACAVVEVTDDGIGGANPDGGSGLGGLRDRVEALNGKLKIESHVGEGTSMRAELPLAARRAARTPA